MPLFSCSVPLLLAMFPAEMLFDSASTEDCVLYDEAVSFGLFGNLCHIPRVGTVRSHQGLRRQSYDFSFWIYVDH
ncbi:hypothetical protein F2Q69_00023477 [Brassica cretica]|uniref:Secreted protein n=1 Tax=Brassica cretica TaxID=69181 RepID=A0A8S9Q8R3_BRACR|nr:hypothetical protein F2Q69_00023477 [Brassica cretica]